MPHSPNLRWTENGTRAAHLSSKGARKFDKMRSERQSEFKGSDKAKGAKKAGTGEKKVNYAKARSEALRNELGEK